MWGVGMYNETLRCAWKRRRALAALGVVAALASAGCGSSSSGGTGGSGTSASYLTGGAPGGTPVRGGTAIIDAPEAPKTLDPVAEAGGPGFGRPVASMFDNLLETFPGKNEPQPGLATSWTVSPDHLTYTFDIRAGVRFSNGQPLTAEDVVYSLQRVTTLPIATGVGFTSAWKKVSAVGPMSVQIQLKHPEPMLLDVLRFPDMAIVSKQVVSHEPESWVEQHPVGTGPFILKSATPGFTTITMVRNPYYWRKGMPYLDGLVFNQVESENARILAVRSGAAQLATGIPYSQVSSLKATPGVRMLVEPIWGDLICAINNTKPPLSEVNVRRALMYATPFQAIIKAVYKGYGTQANSDAIGSMKYWNQSQPVYPYDLAKAKALLKSSSVPNGFAITIMVQGGEAGGEALASILQSAWAKIGVHASIRTLDSATLYANEFSGKFQFVVNPPEAGGSEGFDSQVNISYLLSGTLLPGEVPSASLKAKIEKLALTIEPAARERLVHEIQYQSYWQEPTFIPIVSLVSLSLVSDSVHNLTVLPTTLIRLEEVWLAH